MDDQTITSSFEAVIGLLNKLSLRVQALEDLHLDAVDAHHQKEDNTQQKITEELEFRREENSTLKDKIDQLRNALLAAERKGRELELDVESAKRELFKCQTDRRLINNTITRTQQDNEYLVEDNKRLQKIVDRYFIRTTEET